MKFLTFILSLLLVLPLYAKDCITSLTSDEKANIAKELGNYEEGEALHFIDLNGDGREEVIVALRCVDSKYGCQWLVYAVGKGLKLTVISDSRNSEFFFHIRGVYIAKLANDRELLVCRDFLRGPNCYNFFYLNRDGRVVRVMLKNGIDDILRNADFVRLKRAMKKSAESTISQCLSADKGAEVRDDYISRLSKSSSDIAVEEIMVLDMGVNKDGIRAIYVTSSVERIADEIFRWHLYLVRDNEGVRLKESEVYTFETKNARESLLGVCEASRAEFYEVRTASEGSIPIVAEYKANRLASKAFPSLLSEEDLDARIQLLKEGITEDEWAFGFEEKNKTKAPRDLRQYANDLFLEEVLEIKRVRCKTYKLE